MRTTPRRCAKAAHALKSSSANVGATHLAELCARLEVAAQSSDFASAEGALASLVEQHEQVTRALELATAAA